MHVLLVLEQRPGQHRHGGGRVGVDLGGRDRLGQQQAQPVQQLGGRRLFLQARRFAQREEGIERGAQHVLADVGVVHADDIAHGVAVRKADVVEKAAPQKGVGQVFLVVGGDDDQRAVPRLHGLARLVDMELHAVELAQQVIGEFDVGLVDLVDQQDDRFGRLEGLPQRALHDVVADVADLLVAQLRIAQARDRVVFVQALVRLGGGLDVPLQQRAIQRARHFLGQHRLARAGFALDQEGALQRQRGVDGQLQVVGGDVAVGAFETGRLGGGGRGGRGRGHGVAVNEARQRRGMIRNGLAAIIVQSQGFATG